MNQFWWNQSAMESQQHNQQNCQPISQTMNVPPQIQSQNIAWPSSSMAVQPTMHNALCCHHSGLQNQLGSPITMPFYQLQNCQAVNQVPTYHHQAPSHHTGALLQPPYHQPVLQYQPQYCHPIGQHSQYQSMMVVPVQPIQDSTVEHHTGYKQHQRRNQNRKTYRAISESVNFRSEQQHHGKHQFRNKSRQFTGNRGAQRSIGFSTQTVPEKRNQRPQCSGKQETNRTTRDTQPKRQKMAEVAAESLNVDHTNGGGVVTENKKEHRVNPKRNNRRYNPNAEMKRLMNRLEKLQAKIRLPFAETESTGSQASASPEPQNDEFDEPIPNLTEHSSSQTDVDCSLIDQ